MDISRHAWIAPVLLALPALGCIREIYAVEARVIQDLGCPRDRIEIHPQGGSVFQVSACNQIYTYVCTENGTLSCVREEEEDDADDFRGQPSPAPAQAKLDECPEGSSRQGDRCVASTATTCPVGQRLDRELGCVSGGGPSTAGPPPPRSPECPSGMAYVQGGPLALDANDDVMIPDLCVDITEVTAGAYGRCASRGDCSTEGLVCKNAVATYVGVDRRDHPINCVSWGQATVYCKSERKRLPTADEWLWIARGGHARTLFPWGDDPPSQQPCWSGSDRQGSTCVAGLPKGDSTPHRILGFAGNVAEWTSTKAGADTLRMIRGGHFGAGKDRGATLLSSAPLPVGTHDPGVGFRCVASPER
ncbi:formylglycine-generating enzyme family protein [Chondromyces crocatus]|uniref:Sulfatase-modifying factor enzyme-like domain-containing protein n=1 Tax=Chondromyces crocatus TaxID=52 RepID=A0A0K1EKV5_CHOCO|nr:SUMF1/EgtB/PvdO family nonheme iron enzyme [Chondromyces crocatus]AKT41253.1 uncharacterized protein CMC5_054200 [Chondromyces crocatus]